MRGVWDIAASKSPFRLYVHCCIQNVMQATFPTDLIGQLGGHVNQRLKSFVTSK